MLRLSGVVHAVGGPDVLHGRVLAALLGPEERVLQHPARAAREAVGCAACKPNGQPRRCRRANSRCASQRSSNLARGGRQGCCSFRQAPQVTKRRIIQQQRKITEASKKLEMKKLYQVLVVIDDFADTPQLHKPHGALDTLFIRGRHMQISTWVSSQKLRLISAAVRVNMQFLCCWRLRNQHELDAVIEELSALLPKGTGCMSRRRGNPTVSSLSTT